MKYKETLKKQNLPTPNRETQKTLINIRSMSRPVIQYHEAAFGWEHVLTISMTLTRRVCWQQAQSKSIISNWYVNVVIMNTYHKVENFVLHHNRIARYESASKNPIENNPDSGIKGKMFLEKPGLLRRRKKSQGHTTEQQNAPGSNAPQIYHPESESWISWQGRAIPATAGKLASGS